LREPGRGDVREPGRSDVREPGRNDVREPGRFQNSGRPEGNRGRNDGPRGGDGRNDGNRGRRGGRNDGGRNDGGRGRRNDGPPRGGRDMGRGRDLGGPRRGRTIQPSGEVVEGTFDGVLELHPRGYGFLRDPKRNYAAEDSNPFVSSSLVEKYKLRQGVLIRGDVGQGTRNQGPRLREVELIDGFTPEEYLNVKNFDNLTAINPFEQIKLEIGPKPLTMRVMDLLCPIGKGQRALLVAPPRTGKTMLLQDMANSVSINHPEIHLMVLLIDERPEEVTEMRRMVKGEVISSSLDSDVESHIRIAELIIERAKRLAEEGKDVFILLDSITRLARAFNKANNSGRTGTGGLDIRAMDIPKKLFGQARRFDEGGSLTVCGTALIDTGGRIDEAIFQEFKGTGNMEMVLSRELADRRIWPSIDITKSGTRREEKILAPDLLEGITMLRRSLISLSPVEAMEQLTKTMERFPTNREFLTKIKAVL
jgi:transcription termination factor Rho